MGYAAQVQQSEKSLQSSSELHSGSAPPPAEPPLPPVGRVVLTPPSVLVATLAPPALTAVTPSVLPVLLVLLVLVVPP